MALNSIFIRVGGGRGAGRLRGLLGAAAAQQGGGGRVAAQGAQRRQVVGTRAVPAVQRLRQQGAVADGRAGQGGAVAGEIGHQERAQPGTFAHRLVQRLGEPEAVLHVLGAGGTFMKGNGEGAAEHTQLLRTEHHAAAGSVWRGHGPTIRANRTNSTHDAAVGAPCARTREPPGGARARAGQESAVMAPIGMQFRPDSRTSQREAPVRSAFSDTSCHAQW